MVAIGDIEIPIVSSIEEGNDAAVDEINPIHGLDKVAVKHSPRVTKLEIFGYLNEDLHSSSLSLGEQKDAVKSLRKKSVDENSFSYKQYTGYLLVEDVNLPDNNNSRIVKEVEILCRYFPWPKYKSDLDDPTL